MEIKTAKKEDALELEKISMENLQDGWKKEDFLGTMKEQHAKVCVAWEKNHMTGYGIIYDCKGEGELVSIAVRPKYRRCGIGNLLLKEMKTWIEEKQGSRVVLEVRKSNKSAKDFYVSQGARELGIRPGCYHNPTEDGVIMEIEIENRG